MLEDKRELTVLTEVRDLLKLLVAGNRGAIEQSLKDQFSTLRGLVTSEKHWNALSAADGTQTTGQIASEVNLNGSNLLKWFRKVEKAGFIEFVDKNPKTLLSDPELVLLRGIKQ